jgi:hypothetical protein
MSVPLDDDAVEARLRVYRPARAPAELRERILRVADAETVQTRLPRWLTLAALLLVALAIRSRLWQREGPCPRSATRPHVLDRQPPRVPPSPSEPIAARRTTGGPSGAQPLPRSRKAQLEVLVSPEEEALLRQLAEAIRVRPMDSGQLPTIGLAPPDWEGLKEVQVDPIVLLTVPTAPDDPWESSLRRVQKVVDGDAR